MTSRAGFDSVSERPLEERNRLRRPDHGSAQVRMRVKGRSIHPGLAKGELVNAVKLAAAIVDRLPKDRLSPETTSEREG